MNPQNKQAGNLGISPKQVSFEVPEVPGIEVDSKVNSGLVIGDVGEEAVEPWVAKHGVRPSESEVENHRAACHIPYRNWCPECNMGGGKEDFHKRADEREREVPLVSMDYMYLEPRDGDKVKSTEEAGELGEPELDDDDKLGMPIIIVKDEKTKAMSATVVPKKGVDPFAVRSVSRDVNKIWGYNRVVMKDDQEPAIKALREAVRLESGMEILNEESPVGDSQSNGGIENAVQDAQGQIRTTKLGLERRLERKVKASHPILAWLVRHAVACITRYRVGPDGKTAYRRIRGRNFNRKITEFGECVWYLKARSKGRGKLDT